MANTDNTYTLVINGKPAGPYTLQQLKDLRIQPNDFVKAQAWDDYKEAHEVAELRRFFGFDKQALLQYFAGLDQRLLAAALDWFMVSGVCIILAFVVSMFFSDKMVLLSVALGLLVVIPIVKFIYQVVMESSAKQGTYGKQLLDIKVCDMHGNRISTAQAIGRNLAKVLSVLTLFIGYLYSYFNKQQQCLHDMIAGTLVIKDRL